MRIVNDLFRTMHLVLINTYNQSCVSSALQNPAQIKNNRGSQQAIRWHIYALAYAQHKNY